MEALRVGGIVSGLDTNAIVDSMVASAMVPVDRLNEKSHFLALEQAAYNNVIDAITILKESLFPLKLESTFKSKDVSVANPNILSASASTEAKPGVYNVDVDQLAANSFATSYVPKTSFFQGANMGTGEIDVPPAFDYQIEGMHSVTVDDFSANVKMATDEFKAADGRQFEKFLAGDANLSPTGRYHHNLNTINGKQIDFEIVIDGVTTTIPINFNGFTNPLQIQEIAKSIEDQLNVGLGTEKYDQKMAVKTEFDTGSNKHKLAFYNSNGKQDMDIKIVSGDPTLISNLGLPAAGSPTTGSSLVSSGRVETMINQVMGATFAGLTDKMIDPKGGVIPGIKLALLEGETEVKPGTFGVLYDSSVNRKLGSPTQVLGNTFDKISNVPSGTTPPNQGDIDTWLGSYFTTTTPATLFDEPVVGDTVDELNGFFHINGTKIEIPDISLLTPNSLMGLINSSGAGVKASWDYKNNFFKLERTMEGPNDIKLGETGDTSNILDFLKLSLPSGSIHIRGSDKGTVDTAAPIKESGISTLLEPARGIFTINDVAIFLDTATDSVDDVIRKINTSGAGVSMTYDKELDKFRLDSTSSIAQITVGSPRDTSNFLDAIGITDTYETEVPVGTAGQNSIFTVDGVKYERKSNEIDGIIPGLSMTITDLGMTTLTIDLNTDKAVDAVAEFAVKYNELMLMLSPEPPTKEHKDKYWEPLSAEQKQQMSESEVATYEENHIMLRNNETMRRSSELKTIKANLRTTLTGNVNTTSKFNNLTDIGLNIAGGDAGDWSTTKKGLFIDTSTDVEKITEIIKNGNFVNILKADTDEVVRFFNENEKTVDNENEEADYKVVSEGWTTRYDTWTTDNSNSSSVLYKKAGSNGSIENQLNRLQEQIKVQSARVESYLERLWQSFTDMEIRMQQIQEQSNALAQIGQA